MIDGVAFASCYVYSPAGNSTICARSRLLRTLLKAGDEHFLLKYVVRVRQQMRPASALAGFFLSGDVLVPVPRSTPKPESTWIAARLAQALVREGMGCAVWPGLRRISAVCKSATAAKGSRPSVMDHYESFRLEVPEFRPTRVVLIDDVITRGRTILAAAARLHEALPDTEISAFALLRTLGYIADLHGLIAPCRGRIRWMHGDAQRCP